MIDMRKQPKTDENLTIQDPYLQTLHPTVLDDLNDAGVELVPCQKQNTSSDEDLFEAYLRISEHLSEIFNNEDLVMRLDGLLNMLN